MGNKQTPDWDVLFFFLYFGPPTCLKSENWTEPRLIFESVEDIIYFVFYMLLRIIYIVVLWVFVDQVFLDSEGLYQIPDLTALDTRHNIFISGSFSISIKHSRTEMSDLAIQHGP